MHDQLTGAGGLSLGIMTILISALSIGQLRSGIIIQGIIVAEVSAKLSMVVVAWAGKSVHQGMNTTFLAAMHGGKGDIRLLAALAISLAVALPLLHLAGLVIVIISVITGLVMVEISHRHFNGVTGDVFGATNELARMVSVIVLLAAVAWV
jgi:adenosylcobinamide-GDP ribazoletransferase